MYWLLIIVLFHADPSALPDVQVRPFATEQACNAAIVELGTALQSQDFSGYASGGIKCEAVQNPLTAKKV